MVPSLRITESRVEREGVASTCEAAITVRAHVLRVWKALGWLSWIGVVAAIVGRFSGRAGDDIYISYRYAYNLAHGRGLVFNPGEKVFGISDPGLAMLLAALNRVTGVEIPVLGTWVTGVALLVIAGALLAASREHGRETEGWLGGTLVLGSAYVWFGQGAGTLPALALLLLAARSGRSPWLAGLLTGLAFCCRPDAALGAIVLALLLIGEAWRGAAIDVRGLHARLSRPSVFALVFGAVAAPALAAAWLYYGTPLPDTLLAKRHFAALAPETFTGTAFWRSALQVFCGFTAGGGPALLLLGVVGQGPLFRSAGRSGRFLIVYSLAMASFYTIAALPFFIWYTIPTAIAVLYGAPFALGAVLRAARQIATTRAAQRAASWVALSATVAVGTVVLLAAFVGSYRWWQNGDAGNWRLFAYRKAGEWIRDHTPPTADVAFDEVGILGYASDHPIVDLVGLVTPRSRPYAAAGDPLGAFLAKPSELLLFHTYDPRGGTRPILIRPWFADAYKLVATIPDPERSAETRIYQRQPGAWIPPPRPPVPRAKRAPESS